MKIKIVGLIAVLSLVASLSAYSQVRYVANGALEPQTFTCAATAGTNVGYVLDVRNQASVTLQVTLMANTTGAYTFTLPVQYSTDGQTYDGKAPLATTISFNGVTAQTIITNLPTHGCGWMKIPYVTNATAAINITNGVISAPVNWSAPRPAS